MTTYILIPLCFLSGYFLQRYSWANKRVTPALNNFAIYIALPAIILAKVPELDFTPDVLFPVISAWLGMALSASILIPLGRKLGWRRDITIAVVVLAGLGNTAFLGMAMVKLLLPDGTLPYAIIYDQIGSFVILSIACPLALSFNNPANAAPSFLSIAKRVLLFPPFICLIIALTLPIAWLTTALETPLDWLGWSLLPMAMLIVGLQFQFRIDPAHRLPTLCALGIKMVLLPLLVISAGAGLSITPHIFQASVLQSAMPPMVTPAIFLISLNIAPRLTSTVLSFGTLFSFVTIPTIAFLLT